MYNPCGEIRLNYTFAFISHGFDSIDIIKPSQRRKTIVYSNVKNIVEKIHRLLTFFSSNLITELLVEWPDPLISFLSANHEA